MPNDVVGLDGCSVKVVDQERVAAARAELLPEDEITRLTELFRLLGDPTRLRLLYALLEAGDQGWFQHGACSVNGGGVTGRAGTNDYYG